MGVEFVFLIKGFLFYNESVKKTSKRMNPLKNKLRIAKQVQ